MEMSIDEVIKELEWALANNTIEDVESAFKYISAIHMAIETMHKYQKIQEIVKNADTNSTIKSSIAFSKIKKEVEYGDDK